MTIKITDDKIQFDNFSLALSARGVSVTDKNNSSVLAELKAQSILSATYSFQGSQFGYISGGYATTSTTPDYTQRIQKFPLAVCGGLLNHVANLIASGGHGLTGCKSAINGYTCGGFYNGFPYPGNEFPSVNTASTKSKINFASDVNLMEGGAISVWQAAFGGAHRFDYAAGNSSLTHGYVTGGRRGSPFAQAVPPPTMVSSTAMRKFSFSFDEGALLIASLNNASEGSSPIQTMATGCSSSTHGHVITELDIHKFPYASETTQAFFPNATQGSNGKLATGLSSATHGYIAGGSLGVPDTFGGSATGFFADVTPAAVSPYGPGDSVTNISKFSFTTLGFAVQISDLTHKRGSATGISSISHGIVYGGRVSPFYGSGSTFIERFPFASDVNAIEVGDIGTNRSGAAGFQY
jgi:hypothetical protein